MYLWVLTDESKEKHSSKNTHSSEQSSLKRPRQEERSSSWRGDPTSAPDPEEPEKIDDNVIKSLKEEGFAGAEDDNTVTLDHCK